MAAMYDIQLPTSLTGFAPDLTLTSSASGWGKVIEGERGPRQGNVIRVPDIIFHATRRVEDEIAYRLAADGTLIGAGGPPKQGSIAVILESPHRDEFDGRGGKALGPLRNEDVREKLRAHLPRLLASVGVRLGEGLAGRSVALVNAVQYQASLQAIMRDYGGKLQSGVRTPVWRRIFREGGAADFEARLEALRPHVVLVATTAAVRRDVLSCLARQERAWPWVEVDYHPSYWGRRAPNLRGEIHRGILERAAKVPDVSLLSS